MAESSLKNSRCRNPNGANMFASLDETLPSKKRERRQSEPSRVSHEEPFPSVPLPPANMPFGEGPHTPRECNLLNMSDDYLDMKCTSCDRSDGNRAKAYCLQCRIYLCVRCLRTHDKNPDKKKHRTLKGTMVPGTLTVKKINTTENTEKCLHHSDKFVERFCYDHDIFCCQTCVNDQHSNCKLQTIEQLLIETNFTKLKNDSTESIKGQLKLMTELRIMLTENKQWLTDGKHRITSDVQNFTKKLIEEINTFERQFLTEMNAKLDKKCDLIEKNIKTCNSYITKLSKEFESLDKPKAVRDSKQRQLIALKTVQSSKLKEYNRVYLKLKATLTSCHYEFRQNKQLFKDVTKARNIGSLKRSSSANTQDPKGNTAVDDTLVSSTEYYPLSNEPNVRETLKPCSTAEIRISKQAANYQHEHADNVTVSHSIEPNLPKPNVNETLKHISTEIVYRRKQTEDICCWMDGDLMEQTCITDMELLDDGSVILVDSQNHRIKLFEVKQTAFKAISEMQLDSEPRGISKQDKASYIVTLPTKKSIAIVKLNGHDFQRDIKTLDVGEECTDVIVCEKEIILSAYDDHYGQLISTNFAGVVQRRLFRDTNGKQLFTRPNYLCKSDDSRVLYISDADMGVYGLEIADFTVLFHYKQPSLLCPLGLTLDASGCILILGGKGHPIHRISTDGKSAYRCQISLPDILKNPQCICFLPPLDEYLVACDNSYDIVRVIIH